MKKKDPSLLEFILDQVNEDAEEGLGHRSPSAEARLLIDIDEDGDFESFVSDAEFEIQKEYTNKGIFSFGKAEKNIDAWENLSNDQISHNAEEKVNFLSRLDDSLINCISIVLTDWVPSKVSPDPIEIILRDGSDPKGSVRQSNLFFNTFYQMANFFMNGHRFDWADRAFQDNKFSFEMLRGTKEGEKIPFLKKDALSVYDLNASSLVSIEECREIFGDLTPDQLSLNLSRLMNVWNDNPQTYFSDVQEVLDMVGHDSLPENMAFSGPHYAAAIEVGVRNLHVTNDERAPATGLGKSFVKFLERFLIDSKNFSSEKEATQYLLSNPEEFDDYLYDEKALDWKLKDRLETSGEASMPSEAMISAIKDAQKKVKRFTDLIDKKWAELYEKEGIKALKNRFGHPVGLPTESLKDYHFLVGGYLAESEWVKIFEGPTPGFSINLPVDQNGRPDPNTSAWQAASPMIVLSDKAGKLEKLGQLAEGLVTATEAWHVCYNRGLHRDSLYMAAALSNIDPNVNGSSQDDYSGSVRGLYHPWLKGLEFALGHNMKFYPTMRSKISAISRRLTSPLVTPRGVLALSEIDLSNWRITRWSDNRFGNEYGFSVYNTDQYGNIPHNFDKMDRSYHEGIQKKIARQGLKDGVASFVASTEEMVRPLLGRQRGEAVALFVTRPGTYLRRTGIGGNGIFDGAPKAFYQHIKSPLTPWISFFDPALGKTTDGADVVNHLPGALSLNPYHFCLPGSNIIEINGLPHHTGFFSNKMLAVGAGSRGENVPKKLRFAAASLGEKASHNGLIDANVYFDEGKKISVEVIKNTHSFLKDQALVTEDAPVFSEKLTSAPWHTPEIFVKDFELGSMGDTYLKLGDSEEERLRFLQWFHNGKVSYRQSLCHPDAEVLHILQMNYSMAVDSGLVYGNLETTGLMIGEDDLSPRHRRIGLDRGIPIHRVASGSFETIKAWKRSGKMKYEFHREDDKVFTRHDFILGGRVGYRFTGLEDTPLRYNGDAPKDLAAYVTNWSQTVLTKALDKEYEPMESTSHPEKTRQSFARFYQRFIEKNKNNDKMPQEDWHFYLSMQLWAHPSTVAKDWNATVRLIWEDARAMLAATGRSSLLDQELNAAGLKAKEAMGPRSGVIDQILEQTISEYQKRGKK